MKFCVSFVSSRTKKCRSTFQDKWIKLLLEPKKFTGPSFVLFLSIEDMQYERKNEHKLRKQIDVVFILCINGSITLKWH